MLTREEITQWFMTLQDNICNALEQADGKGKFKEDNWTREGGGGGRTRIIEKGTVIEKGGVLFSAVHGALPDFLKKETTHQNPAKEFYATGVSIVIHPENPFVPIIHMNVRYFEMDNGTYWFGGGIDLTPHYIHADDAKYFHQHLQHACQKHDADYYPKFKTWADDYFFIKHRNETRGIGGIFFDHLQGDANKNKSDIFEFVKSVGETFAPVYTHLMNKNKHLPYTDENKQWQYMRRGRYVEFNLVYDRGTRFGLETNGRTESILMSLPETAKWFYNYQPKKNSAEAQTLALLVKGKDWLA
jgi:coproporphyrinogen III oxidase